ncbi:MAG: transcription elongation factor GreA [Dehalococcoidia bacterium]
MVQNNPSMNEAARAFAQALPPEKHQDSQEALRFARWYGEDKPAIDLRPVDIELYVETFGANSPLASARAESLKTFLAYAHKQNITSSRLVSHVRVRRPAGAKRIGAAAGSANRDPQEIRLTSEGKAVLETELDQLISERPRIAEELRHARSDGDVRENAPLDAAREAQGKLEARIRELEAMLRLAVIVENDEERIAADVAHIGSNVVISNLATGAKLEYQIVNAAEARGGTGRLSFESPVGQAVVGHKKGDVVEVVAPSGIIRFRIESVSSR